MMTSYSHFQIVPTKTSYILFFVCLHICLVSAVFGAEKPMEPELFDLLSNDLDIEAISEQNASADMTLITNKTVKEPNIVTAQIVPKPVPVISPAENDLLLANHPSTSPEKELWKARISSSAQQSPNQAKTELARLMQRISAVKLEPQTTKTQSILDAGENTEPESDENISGSNAAETPEQVKEEKTRDPGAVSQETIEIIHNYLSSPDQLNDPLGLGDLLYESGCIKDAAACYKLALDRLSDSKIDPLENKPWILFQLGNCLQNDNLDEALKYYQSVVVDYSKSMWNSPAQAKVEWIQWRLQDKPETLTGNPELNIKE